MPVCSVIWIVCVFTWPGRRDCHFLDAMAGSVPRWPRLSVGTVQAGVREMCGAGSGATRFSLGSSAWQRRTFRRATASAACWPVQKQALVGGYIESSLLWQGFLPPWKLYSRSLRASALCVCPSAVCRSGPAARFGPGMCAGHSSLDSPRCWRAGGKTPLFSPPVCKQTVRG